MSSIRELRNNPVLTIFLSWLNAKLKLKIAGTMCPRKDLVISEPTNMWELITSSFRGLKIQSQEKFQFSVNSSSFLPRLVSNVSSLLKSVQIVETAERVSLKKLFGSIRLGLVSKLYFSKPILIEPILRSWLRGTFPTYLLEFFSDVWEL